MEENKEWIKSGKLFEGLIRAKGYTPYSFAKKTNYSKSRLYRLCAGDADIMSVEFYNIVVFSKVLGYKSITKFAIDLQLDLLEDIL